MLMKTTLKKDDDGAGESNTEENCIRDNQD